MKALDLALIGCGAVVGELHLGAIRRLARQSLVNVTVLVDRNQTRAGKLRRFFPGALCFAEVDDAFAARAVDLALVASPAGLHRSHIDTVLTHGGHVLCEKPLATSARDAAEVARLSERLDRIVMVGLTRRFFPSLATAAAMVARGELGDYVEFRCFEGSVYSWPVASDAPFSREIGGGGVLSDKGVHVLDSLLWLFGKMQVVRSEDDALAGGVEANCRISLEGDRARGVMQLSWDQQLANSLHITGASGDLFVAPNEFGWIEFQGANHQRERRPCRADWPETLAAHDGKRLMPRTYEDCVYLEWIQFLRAVVLQEPVAVDASSAVTVSEQIETAYAQASPLLQSWLTPEEQAAAVRRHWHSTPLFAK